MALTAEQTKMAHLIVKTFENCAKSKYGVFGDFGKHTPEQMEWMLNKVREAAFRDPDKWGAVAPKDLYERLKVALEIMGPGPRKDKQPEPVEAVEPVVADVQGWGEW